MITRGLGAGSYPEPKENKTQTIKVTCTFKTEVEVPEDLDTYFEIKEYIEEFMTTMDLLENADEILIDDVEKVGGIYEI